MWSGAVFDVCGSKSYAGRGGYLACGRANSDSYLVLPRRNAYRGSLPVDGVVMYAPALYSSEYSPPLCEASFPSVEACCASVFGGCSWSAAFDAV